MKKILCISVLCGLLWTGTTHTASIIDSWTPEGIVRNLRQSNLSFPFRRQHLERVNCRQMYEAIGARMAVESETDRVFPALHSVLEEMEERGERPPTFLFQMQSPEFWQKRDAEKELERNWSRALAQRGVAIAEYESPSRMKPRWPALHVLLSKSEVYPVEVREKGNKGEYVKRYFRPAGEEGSQVGRQNHASGKTYAASWFNNEMGLDIVPGSEIAIVNGRLGTLSEVSPGKSPGFFNALPDAKRMSNIVGFEFLLGNADGLYRNFHNETNNVFDHDRAFEVGIPFFSKSDFLPHERNRQLYFGTFLPSRYTREFVEALQKLDHDKICKELSPHLTRDEIEGLWFRRRVMLRDIERRGDEALIGPQ